MRGMRAVTLVAVVPLKPPVLATQRLKQGSHRVFVVSQAGHILADKGSVAKRMRRITAGGARIERELRRARIAAVTEDIFPGAIVFRAQRLRANAGSVIQQLLDGDL